MKIKLLKILISLFLLFLFIKYNFDKKTFPYEIIQNLDYRFLIIVVLLMTLELFFSCLRWHFISKEYLKESFINSAKFYLSSLFLSIFVTPVGGDIYRLYRYKNKIEIISKLVLFERIFSIFIIFLTPLFFFNVEFNNSYLNKSNDILSKTSLFLLFIMGASILFIRFTKLNFWKTNNILVKTIINSCNLFFNKKLFFRILFINLVCTFIFFFTAFYLTAELNLGIPFKENSFFIYLSDKMRFIPLFFQGMGLKEISYTKLLDMENYREDLAFIFSVLFYNIELLILLFWSFLGYNLLSSKN
jgi:hypothetical protein